MYKCVIRDMKTEQEKLIDEMNQAFISISEITNREPDDYDDVLNNIDLIREICEGILKKQHG